MNEIDLRAVQITKEAVMRLIAEAARAAKKQEPELLRAEEVAAKLRFSKWRFYHVYKDLGLVPVRGVGRRLLFQRGDVERLMGSAPARLGRPPKAISRPLARDEVKLQGTFRPA